MRVARRFGLVAVAGELASHYGLTGWDEGEAIGSVSKCFLAWLDAFGGAGNREDRTILEHVRAFIAAHGASRFEDMHGTGDHRVPNRVGFFRADNNGTRDYLIPVESFRREVCSGFDPKAVADVLLKAGWLVPGEGSRPTQKPRLPGMGPVRCYVLTAGMWKE